MGEKQLGRRSDKGEGKREKEKEREGGERDGGRER